MRHVGDTAYLLERTKLFKRASETEEARKRWTSIRASLRSLSSQTRAGDGPPAGGGAPPPPANRGPAGNEPRPVPPREGLPPAAEGAGENRPPGEASPAIFDFATWITKTIGGIVSNVVQVFLQFVLMIYILFYFLRDGPTILHALRRAIPVDSRSKDTVVEAFRAVSRSVFRGTFGTALAQGLFAGLAFLVVGVPPVFWGVMVAFSSLIPPIGTSLILIPMTIYLLAEGNWWKGILIGIVTILVGLLDHILRPILVGQGLRTHTIWLLLSILGGMAVLGFMGLVYGPLVVVLLGTVLAMLVQEERTQTEPPAQKVIVEAAGAATTVQPFPGGLRAP